LHKKHNQQPVETLHTSRYNNSIIYQMKCLDCPLKYVGQTRRMFNARYKEHVHAIRSNNSNSRYSNHILNYIWHSNRFYERHKKRKEGRHLNTLEKFTFSRNNLHMNNTHIEAHNPIFQTVHELYDRSQYTRYLERYLSKNNHIKSI
jgi:hypothetical protein